MATPQFDAIPAALRILPHWMLWKYEPGKNGKPTKVPKTVDGNNASSTAPRTWSRFDDVRKTFESGGYDGIGFVFTRDAGITGIDLDHCRYPDTGVIDDWAVAIIAKLSSYTEVSPSGTGVHVIVRGLLPEKAKHKKTMPGHQKDAAIELYSNVRFFTFTGNRLPDAPDGVEDRQDELDALYREQFTPQKEETQPATQEKPVAKAGNLTDQQVVEHARLAKNGSKFKALWDGSLLGYNGDESAADLALMNLIAFYCGGDRAQMERIFSASALGKRDKWQTRPDYRERTINKALEGRTEFYTPGLSDEDRALLAEKARDALAGLPERLKADPRAIKEAIPDLARLKADDPIEFDLVLGDIKATAPKIKVDTIHKAIAEFAKKKESQKATEDPAIKEKALAIATRGDPLRYLIWQAQRNHLGDIDYQKVLLLSIASAASETSHGIQPGGNGEKGSGKSDACDATYHLIPGDRRLDGSLSPMSLFYLQETGQLKPGMVLFSDDVEYGPIIPIYKRSTGKFQNASNHYTVSGGKDRKSLKLTIPPRVVWWLTSVESVANEQAFDRQYPISTDSSPEHKKRVAREIADRRARPEKRFAEDEGVEIARAIVADMMDSGPFKVTIPQAECATWLKTSDFRGQEQFWDLVDALVVMRWRQHRRDSNGWLIAEDRDLIEAKDLMMAHKVAHFADLTEAEVKVVGVLSDGMPRTQKELTEALGVAQTTISERLKSILSKSSIITEDQEQGKKFYHLNPNADLNASYWQGVDLIDLGIDDGGRYRRQQIALSVCYRYVIGVPIGITINSSNRIPTSLSVKRTSLKRGACGGNCGVCLGWDTFSSLAPAENTDNDRKQQQAATDGTDNTPISDTDNTDNAISEPRDLTIRQAGDAVDISAAQDAIRDQHFAEKAIEVAANSGRDEPTPVVYYEQSELVRFNTEAHRETISYVAGDECVAPLDHARNIVTIPHIDVSMDGLGGDAEKRCTQDSLQDQIPNLEVVEISSLPAWKEALQEIAQAGICGLDLETTGLDPLSSKARLAQFSLPSGRVYVADLWKLAQEGGIPLQDLGLLLENPGIKKVGHNLKFDLAFIQASCGRRLHISNIFDTMLASQVCWAGYYASGEMEQTLRSIAKRHLGIDLSKELQVSNWGAEFLSAEQIAYAARDAGVLLPLHDILLELLKRNGLEQIAELEFGVIPSVIELELRGLPLDVEACRAMVDEKRLQLQKITQNFQARGLNPNSPKQLLAFLRSQGYNIPSTKEESLKELVAAGCSCAEEILQYRRLAKQAKFLDDWLQRSSPIDGRLHSTYFQLSTRSGRFSSKNPNAQQIPKRGEDGKAMRRLFKAPPGKKIIKGDFSGIELRIMARLSQDKTMIEAFQVGQDLHKLTASKLARVPIDQVTKEQRQSAKSANFGLIYGVSARRFRENAQIQYGVNMSQEEAEQIRNAFFATYPGVQAFHRTQKALKQHPQAYIFHNAERGFYSTPMVCIQTISGRKRIWDWEKGQNLARDTMLYNSPSQGTGADLIKAVMAEVYNSLPEDVKMIGSVHDEVLLEAPEASAKEIADLLLSIMKHVGSELLFPVPVDAEVEIMDSWGGV